MPANHNPRFRVGTSQHYITVTQTINGTTKEWNAPVINIPEMKSQNIPATNEIQKAIGKAIVACNELKKYTGRPA